MKNVELKLHDNQVVYKGLMTNGVINILNSNLDAEAKFEALKKVDNTITLTNARWIELHFAYNEDISKFIIKAKKGIEADKLKEAYTYTVNTIPPHLLATYLNEANLPVTFEELVEAYGTNLQLDIDPRCRSLVEREFLNHKIDINELNLVEYE